MTSVVLADDQELVRSGLRALLEARGVEVLAEAENGRAAVEATRIAPTGRARDGHPDAGHGRHRRDARGGRRRASRRAC